MIDGLLEVVVSDLKRALNKSKRGEGVSVGKGLKKREEREREKDEERTSRALRASDLENPIPTMDLTSGLNRSQEKNENRKESASRREGKRTEGENRLTYHPVPRPSSSEEAQVSSAYWEPPGAGPGKEEDQEEERRCWPEEQQERER